MPKYKVGMKVVVISADCNDSLCSCSYRRLGTVGRQGEITEVRIGHGGRANNPHHYQLSGDGLDPTDLWTDCQIRRYRRSCRRENTN